MHELGLAEAIVRAAEEQAGGRPVRALTVTVGGGHVADDDALRQAFAMSAQGTVAADAALEIRVDPLRLRCGSCGAETIPDSMTPACPRCGGVDVELIGGENVVLDQLTLEPG